MSKVTSELQITIPKALTKQYEIAPGAALDWIWTALRGVLTDQISWFDAHLLAYAERYGLQRLISEDFRQGRLYGAARARDPFQ